MSININAKQDVSYLFSGLNQSTSGSGGNSMSWLGDYASIKNGSYGKLMKAYYSETANDKVGAIAKSAVNRTEAERKEKKAELSKAEGAADALKESADALLKKGRDSVFEKEDENALYDAVCSFIKNYNSTISAAGRTGESSVSNRVNNMTGNAAVYTGQLAKIGITIGEDKTLSIDKDVFMGADRSKVQDLFQANGSFGYQISAQASLISYAAEKAVASTGLYLSDGNNNYSTGNLFNRFF